MFKAPNKSVSSLLYVPGRKTKQILLFQSLTSITPPSSDASVDFDLGNQSYYLLLALGPLGGNGNIAYHNTYLMSGDKVNLAEFSAPQMDKNLLITLHAGEDRRPMSLILTLSLNF